MAASPLDHSSITISSSMSPIEAVATMSSVESLSLSMGAVVHRKFGEMELHAEEEEDDGDYSPSEVDSDDSLEWASETERTMAEDALAEGSVGLLLWGCCVCGHLQASADGVELGHHSSGCLSPASCQGCKEG